MAERHFTPALFAFLRELAANNGREWFAANKPRYLEAVQEPALEFVADFAPLLETLSPHFVADPRPVGGSLFRIYRDTRFSKDKTPYKTHTGIRFRHETVTDVHAAGYYLHLAPGNVMVVAGVWRPDSPSLSKIRDAIAAGPEEWQAVVSEPGFASRYELAGESLKRPPAGYDPEHPAIDDLKRKDFVAVSPLAERDVTARAFPDRLAERWRAASPFMRFLCRALDVPF
jgi:uncharacterized protein (TIGR02453 family)